ncbi:hypothetical protein LAJ19_09390 [Deinococcus taeanensis]|uniref:SH3 domain-containing protein n=1 Tax=Deinococcus taeanensis TaxID=2737050 RepID=UPI001CDD6684|nr:SH3 domain-containing protein [Deinococcus taeanensis]UBV41859.1 hypothetical protein LAJ19_09390 [Deinococcus taeanensis]
MLRAFRFLLRSAPVLAFAMLGSGGALSGWATRIAPLYAMPNQKSAALLTLPARIPLEVQACFAMWCQVKVGTRSGWLVRAAVNVPGGCSALVPLGLKNLWSGEGAYSVTRDANRNGRACDQTEYLQSAGRR